MTQREILELALIGAESELDYLKEIIRELENDNGKSLKDDCSAEIRLDDYKQAYIELYNKYLGLNKLYEECEG